MSQFQLLMSLSTLEAPSLQTVVSAKEISSCISKAFHSFNSLCRVLCYQRRIKVKTCVGQSCYPPYCMTVKPGLPQLPTSSTCKALSYGVWGSVLGVVRKGIQSSELQLVWKEWKWCWYEESLLAWSCGLYAGVLHSQVSACVRGSWV